VNLSVPSPSGRGQGEGAFFGFGPYYLYCDALKMRHMHRGHKAVGARHAVPLRNHEAVRSVLISTRIGAKDLACSVRVALCRMAQ